MDRAGPRLAGDAQRLPLSAARGNRAGAASAPGRPVPAQIPPEVAGFAGRDADAAAPDAAAAPASPRGSRRSSMLTGTAGVGKTALAIRFARQVAAGSPTGSCT